MKTSLRPSATTTAKQEWVLLHQSPFFLCNISESKSDQFCPLHSVSVNRPRQNFSRSLIFSFFSMLKRNQYDKWKLKERIEKLKRIIFLIYNFRLIKWLIWLQIDSSQPPEQLDYPKMLGWSLKLGAWRIWKTVLYLPSICIGCHSSMYSMYRV